MSSGEPVTADALCDPQFLAALRRLRVVARRVPPRGRFAEHRSRDLGGGLEFRDHRAYSAGDDLRAVDWNLYRRLRRVFVRLFEENEDLPLYLLPDVSESAWFETPPRALAGLKCALGLAAVSLGRHDRVGVFPWSDALRTHVRPTAGKDRVISLARRLAELGPAGRTDLAASLARFDALRLREGLVCLISDFFDPAGLDGALEALRRLRHRLLLVQLVRRADGEPAETGDLRLVDCEDGETTDVSVTASVLERYRSAYSRFEERLTAFARSHGAGFLRLDADAEVLPQLATLFHNGVLAV